MAPPDPPSPMMQCDQRHADLQTGFDRAGNRLGLSARFGFHAGKSAGGIDQSDDRQAETVGQMHQTLRLAVAFGLGHAEIMLDAAFGIVAAFLADDDDRHGRENGQCRR